MIKKLIALFFVLSIKSEFTFCQKAKYKVFDFKELLQAKNKKYFHYFRIVDLNNDTVQIIQYVKKYKKRINDIPFFVDFDFGKAKKIKQSDFYLFVPYLTKQSKAYYGFNVELIFF